MVCDMWNDCSKKLWHISDRREREVKRRLPVISEPLIPRSDDAHIRLIHLIKWLDQTRNYHEWSRVFLYVCCRTIRALQLRWLIIFLKLAYAFPRYACSLVCLTGKRTLRKKKKKRFLPNCNHYFISGIYDSSQFEVEGHGGQIWWINENNIKTIYDVSRKKKFSSENLSYGHCMRMIGWGKENGQEFWTIANSWGREWGENGS